MWRDWSVRARILAWSGMGADDAAGVGAAGLSIATRHSGVEAGSVLALEALAASRSSRSARWSRTGGGVTRCGWILLAFGLPNVVLAFAEAYTVYGLFTAPGAVPGPAIAA
jgi:hypothetical protein